MTPFQDIQVKTTYDAYPPAARLFLLNIRELVFTLATQSDEVGQVTETLKWGNPSYLTHSPKSGTPLRLTWLSKSPFDCALSVHCQTIMLEEFKQAYPECRYDGRRSLLLDYRQPMPTNTVSDFIRMALTYHARKRA